MLAIRGAPCAVVEALAVVVNDSVYVDMQIYDQVDNEYSEQEQCKQKPKPLPVRESLDRFSSASSERIASHGILTKTESHENIGSSRTHLRRFEATPHVLGRRYGPSRSRVLRGARAVLRTGSPPAR